MPLLVPQHRQRNRQLLQLHALFQRVLHLLRPGRQLRPRAPVEDRHFRPQPERAPRRVHRRVPPADDDRLLADPDRRSVLRKPVRPHQVDPCQELVRRVHPRQILARDVQEPRQPRPRADEDGPISLLVHQLVQRHRLADEHVGLDLRPQGLHILDLSVEDLSRQPELGNPIPQHAPRRVQRFEDPHPIPLPRQISRRRQAGRAGPDNRHLRRIRLGLAPEAKLHVVPLPVRGEPLQRADRHRIRPLAKHARCLALALLRAHPAAHPRQVVAVLQNLDRVGKAPLLQSRDETRNIDPDGASRNAARPRALQAALRLGQRHIDIEPRRHLGEVPRPLLRIPTG